ncbi:hypothetical protein DUI87_18364 [Hirundo rustica rustica]|uniref:Uncharacterized protein n=1 Tax=Hirundo rustica rustica TaxID=333673 RepID=A0A3M0K1P4_HIRRU|nr:hypothetical protein DUI87_18364 [Hirundo rustica rustica]
MLDVIDVIVKPLSITFEGSWRAGEMPEGWRKSSVSPVFKEDPGNYRPVASLQSLERWWNRSSGMSSLFTGSCDRTRYKGHKLECRKFHLNIRKNFFPMKVVVHWGKIACRGCGISFSGDIQKPSQHDPVQAAPEEPALAGVLD